MEINKTVVSALKVFLLMFLLIELLVFSGCKENKKQISQDKTKNSIVDTLSESDPLSDVENLYGKLDSIKYTGDTNSYNELSTAYFMANDLHALYYYSLLMANKYNYNRAYLDLYLALSEPFTGEGFEDLDSKTQKLALFYLLKSAELGNTNAKNVLEERFRDRQIPNSSKYSSLN